MICGGFYFFLILFFFLITTCAFTSVSSSSNFCSSHSFLPLAPFQKYSSSSSSFSPFAPFPLASFTVFLKIFPLLLLLLCSCVAAWIAHFAESAYAYSKCRYYLQYFYLPRAVVLEWKLKRVLQGRIQGGAWGAVAPPSSASGV